MVTALGMMSIIMILDKLVIKLTQECTSVFRGPQPVSSDTPNRKATHVMDGESAPTNVKVAVYCRSKLINIWAA